MNTIHIPETVEALTASLAGLERLLTAKQWERAAIVYAWTEPQQGGDTRFGGNPASRMSLTDFAGLGITGLRDKGQVRLYRKAWESAAAEVGNDDMLDIQPGDAVELPSLPWKEHFGEPTTDVQARVARTYIAQNPEVVADAVRAIPAVADAVTQVVAESEELQGKVASRVFAQKAGISYKPAAPMPVVPVGPDYEQDVVSALGRITAVLEAVREGKWTPSGFAETGLRLIHVQLTEYIGQQAPTVLDDIDAFLASKR